MAVNKKNCIAHMDGVLRLDMQGENIVWIDPTHPAPSARPLCVDLDGTLVRFHTLWLDEKGGLLTASQRMKRLWQVRAHLIKCRHWAQIKDVLAQAWERKPQYLPYNTCVLHMLRAWHAQGRALYLVTGAPQCIAQAVAGYLDLFQGVVCNASDSRENMVGKKKACALLARFGKGAFDYIGDAWIDVHVWRYAHVSYFAYSYETKMTFFPYEIFDVEKAKKGKASQAIQPATHKYQGERLFFGLCKIAKKARALQKWLKNHTVIM